MFEKVVTKSGDVIWMKLTPTFSRHEITRARFEFWDSLPEDVKAAKAERMRP